MGFFYQLYRLDKTVETKSGRHFQAEGALRARLYYKYYMLQVFDITRSLILVHSSSYFFSMFLLSSVGTSAKYLFPLLF